MDLQQLRYIVALSKELNFVRAAKRVGITQPTLSQQIKKLEEELGTPLFERSPHSVRLTNQGQTFLNYAIKALDSLSEGRQKIKESTHSLTGKISIAFIPTIGPYILPPLLKKLKKKAPELTLELFEETTSVLVDHLKTGKFDIGILALPIDDTSLVTKELGEEEFFVCVSKEHHLASKDKISINHMLNQDVLMLQEGHCFRDQALEFCSTHHANPNILFEGSSLVSVMNLAAANVGMTLVPKIAVNKGMYSSLKFIPFSKPKPTRKIGAIWRMTFLPNYAQRFVMDCVEDILK
ncbi:MAG: LysR substrate-binding domain-containing protein [bacterium]|nr:LysR family transcriptional regulator [bacterium]MBU1916904.1 LysR family transcriptional regulator [bacterium]